MRKTVVLEEYSCFVQKTARKNTKYSRNETILKIGHLAKAIAFSNWSVWIKNSNGQKHAQNGCTRRLELFCAKYRWKKHQIFEKWDDFENRPSGKGCNLFKMVSLGKKFTSPKNMGSTVVQEHYSSSVQKTAGKKHQMFEKWDDFENRPCCKGYSLCKLVSLDQKIKMAKNMRKTVVLEE